jgi:hypothetical protein
MKSQRQNAPESLAPINVVASFLIAFRAFFFCFCSRRFDLIAYIGKKRNYRKDCFPQSFKKLVYNITSKDKAIIKIIIIIALVTAVFYCLF